MSGAVRLRCRGERIRSRGCLGALQRVLRVRGIATLSTPHDHSAAETHRAYPDGFDACFTPLRDGLLNRMTPVVLANGRPEEPADLRPFATAGGETGGREHRP